MGIIHIFHAQHKILCFDGYVGCLDNTVKSFHIDRTYEYMKMPNIQYSTSISREARLDPRLLLTLVILCTVAVNSAYAETYNIYIEPLPEWADHASNVVYESTRAWEDANPELKFYEVDDPSDADFIVRWVKDFGGEILGYAYGDELIEVGLGDSDCYGSWQPFSTNFVRDTMSHEIGHILGLEHVDDVNHIMHPIANFTEYDLITDEEVLAGGYGYFFPACTHKDVTTFTYSVSTDDPAYGFDVYFVPSGDMLDKWSRGERFSHYLDESCYGENYLEYSGTCEGVSRGSGLLVIVGDIVTNPLTTITIQMLESPARAFAYVPNTGQLPSPPPEPVVLDEPPGDMPAAESTPSITDSVCGAGTHLENGECVITARPAPGGCLVATAVYGSELAPQVQMLREIRDGTLLSTQSGTSFMAGFNSIYYSFSPTIADLERDNPAFRDAVRLFITPMLATLSIMTLADAEESQVIGLGMLVIALNLGLYVAAPVMAGLVLAGRLGPGECGRHRA